MSLPEDNKFRSPPAIPKSQALQGEKKIITENQNSICIIP